MRYIKGSDLPDYAITWYDRDGNVIDYSSGHTFEVKIAPIGSTTASFTKSSGITGAATAPNITIQWANSGELNSLAAGTYTVQVKATRSADSKDRFNPEPLYLEIIDAIT